MLLGIGCSLSRLICALTAGRSCRSFILDFSHLEGAIPRVGESSAEPPC